MKKIFTLIAMALCVSAANAEIVSDVTGWVNYLYLSADEVKAGQENVFFLNIVQDECGQSVGVEEIAFPEGYVVKKFTAVKTSWAIDESTDEPYLALKPATGINTNKVKIGLEGGGPIANYTAKECQIAKLTVEVPATAEEECNVTMTQAEVSLKEDYWKANGYEFNKEVHDVACKFTVSGATGIEGVAADGTEAAAVAKKVVDGQLVIETANGTFNAAGAQVK